MVSLVNGQKTQKSKECSIYKSWAILETGSNNNVSYTMSILVLMH